MNSMLNKKGVKAVVAVLFYVALSATLYAAGGFGEMETAGQDSQESVKGVIKNFIWVLALLPFGVGFFISMKVKDHLEARDDQGQNEPKPMKYAKIVGGFIAGVVVCFLLYGIFGTTFAGMGFGDIWQKLVIDFWRDAIS